MIRKQGADVVKERISSAAGLLDFQMERVLSEADYADLAGKVAAVGRAVPYLAMAESVVEVDAHIGRLAERLGIDENSIRNELLRQRAKHQGTRLL